ncbi:hypothetical protein [Geomonas sp.]|uniref:hypothetical protein n=1 Tax=Geomonas sp. TaxID=2651584 RepID=UPI002B494572|nr:hypothetical protein [Geomonas sp.]HJV35337.1 hypothetical protein [Geomonas sp.]
MKRHGGAQERLAVTARTLVGALAISLPLLLTACGGGGGTQPSGITTTPSGSPSTHSPAVSSSFAFTADGYGMLHPTFLCASQSSLGLVLRAAIASTLTDPNFQTVIRIDITDACQLVPGGSYSLGGATAGGTPFPGQIYFFNGHPSTLLQSTAGTITFSSIGKNTGDPIAGSFTAVVQDNGSSATPKPTYTIAATFSFSAEGAGPIVAQAPLSGSSPP